MVTNRKMLGALLMSSIFWFVGGTVYPPSINSFGKEQLQLSDLATGIMAASTGLGIAVGCVLAGLLSKDFRVGAMLVVDGKHVVVTEASLTITNEAPDETLIRVNAVDFASVLARATGSPTAVAGPRKSGLAPVIQGDFNPRKRRILT